MKMKQLKYVILGGFLPVVFDAPLEHPDLKLLAAGMFNANMVPGGVTSGGYCMIVGREIVVGGGSIRDSSIVPAPHDAEILSKFFGFK